MVQNTWLTLELPKKISSRLSAKHQLPQTISCQEQQNYTSGFVKIKEICHAVHCSNIMGLLSVASFLREKKTKTTKEVQNEKSKWEPSFCPPFYFLRYMFQRSRKSLLLKQDPNKKNWRHFSRTSLKCFPPFQHQTSNRRVKNGGRNCFVIASV